MFRTKSIARSWAEFLRPCREILYDLLQAKVWYVYHICLEQQLSTLHYYLSNRLLNPLKVLMVGMAKVMRKAALGFLGILLAPSCSATVVRFPLSSIAVSADTSAVHMSLAYLPTEHSAGTAPH